MSKLNLILVTLVGVLVLSLFVVLSTLRSTTDERDRIKGNLDQVQFELNRSLVMTQRELDSYIMENKALDSLLKAERIKPARIEYITEVKHHYHRDTIEVNVGEWEAAGKVFPISYRDECLSFSGRVDLINERPRVGLTNVSYVDNQTHVGYLKKKDTGRRFLWVFPIRKKFLELHTYSDCGDNEVHHIEILK